MVEQSKKQTLNNTCKMNVLLSDSLIRNYEMMQYRFIGKDRMTGIA